MRHFLSALATVLSLVSITSCSYWKNASGSRLISKAELVNSPVNDTIRASMEAGLYVVYVQINNHPETFEFMFDTGANLTVINSDVAAKLGLRSAGSLSVGDSKGERQSLPLVMIDSLRLGEGIYTNVVAASFPFPENTLLSCVIHDGVLGYHVIRQLKWAFHPGDTLLVGSVDSLFSDREYETLPMPGRRSPRLEIDFDGYRYGGVLFDTGSNGGLDLEMRTIVNHADSLLFSTEVDGTSQGLYGNQIDTLQKILNSSIRLGAQNLHSSVDFSQRADRKVGMSTFSPYHFILDGPAEQLHIHPVPEREILPKRTFGVVPGLSDTLLYIASIETHGQGAENGLVLGQKLKSVNGRSGPEIASLPCGYLKFILHIIRHEEELIVETMDGQFIRLKRSIPEHRELTLHSEE